MYAAREVRVPLRRTPHEWTLWVVALATAVHATEEYLSGWQQWAPATLGISLPASVFIPINAGLVLIALVLASIGWRRTAAALVIPFGTLINALFLHILPSILQGAIAPGTWSALFLYVPFSSWAIVAAWRDGVSRRGLAAALVGGAALMAGVVLAARAISTP